jgi:hypothetical protein
MWGYGAAPTLDGPEDGDCGASVGLMESGREFLLQGLKWLRWRCPYTPRVSAMSLLAGGGTLDLGRPLDVGEGRPAPEHRQHPQILRDKVVLYGFDLAGLSDVVSPPTHATLPGVFLHAMALDNLLTWGERYKAPAVWAFDRRIGADSVTFVTFIVVFALCFLTRFRPEVWPTPLGVVLRTVTAWHTLPALCLLLGGIYSLYFDLAIYNWLAIVGFASAVPSVIDALAARGHRLWTFVMSAALRLHVVPRVTVQRASASREDPS